MRLSCTSRCRNILIAGVLFLVIFSFLNIKTGDIHKNSQIWKGYYTLMIDSDSGKMAEKALEQNGVSFISLSGQSVDFFDYCGVKTVPVLEISEHLESLDPRIDPFIKKLPSFFTTEYMGKDWDLIYIKSSEDFAEMKSGICGFLPGTEHENWIIADERERSNPGLKYLAGAFFLLSGMLMGKSFWRLPLFAAAWAGLIECGDTGIFVAAGLVIVSLFFLRNIVIRLWREHLDYPIERRVIFLRLFFPAVLFSGILLIAAFWVSSAGSGLQPVIFLITGSMGHLSALAIEMTGIHLWNSRRDHRLFIPVLLLGKSRSSVQQVEFLVPVIPALVLAAAFVLPFENEEIITPVPAPVFIGISGGESGYDWKGLVELQKNRGDDGYPDLVDYVSHQAFVELFFYGREYSFPEIGSRIEQDAVEVEDGEILREVVVLKEFTDQWYIDILSPENKDGIIALLLNQEGPCKITTAGSVVTGSGSRWKKSGSAIFSLYFSVMLVYYLLKNRRKPENEYKEPETLIYIREFEKENIA